MSATARSANAVLPPYASAAAQALRSSWRPARRSPSFTSVAASAGDLPVAPFARRTPSTNAQSSPLLLAVLVRRRANAADSRFAGGVGSGEAEFSHTVAPAGGPSSSGAGAGFTSGRRTTFESRARAAAWRRAAVAERACRLLVAAAPAE